METRLHQRRRIPHVVQPRRTPHGLSVIAHIQLADQVIRGRADTLHVRPARPQLAQDRPRQPHRPRHQVPSNATHMPMMHHSNIDQLTNGGPAPVTPGWRPPTPTPPKTSVFKLSLLLQDRVVLLQLANLALSVLISASSSLVAPGSRRRQPPPGSPTAAPTPCRHRAAWLPRTTRRSTTGTHRHGR